MPRIKRTMAAAAAVASIAAAGAAPAQADTNVNIPEPPCTQSLPDCTEYLFDTARNGVETGRTTWNTGWGIVDQEACDTYEFVTGEECPSAAKAAIALGYL